MDANGVLLILVVVGLIAAAMAVTAVIAWIGVWLLARWRRTRGRDEGAEQSVTTANRLFDLAPVDDPDAGAQPVERRR